ncbi:tyrosine-protein phosphatase non-receptor type 22-like isoform X2 [Carcharodon carcharias]|uniref:tyrosine-protein phosphatase non-receptor type 22-like isoform X2 n=1 Tax=Carcharodon carcharias TaxID=13397 RepID=UPI001B7F346B|nr:tyrosine-protein phosphatase non-receptor type 22-like isoform X2 [Carcharodon carcharias]
MDQATILVRFLRQSQSKKCSKEENIAGEFLRLKRQSVKNKNDKIYPVGHAEKQENIKKNRYKDIVPFDHSRVQLSLIISDTDSDYINASFIKGVYGPKAYIATQGPLPHTVTDFWRMLWEYNVLVVVMACREFEMGRKKCEQYWASIGEDPYCVGPFCVTCEEEKAKPEYIIRTLKVQFQNIYRTMYQLHYVNWPDHDVPSSIDPILELIKDMRNYQPHDDIPICIHCSAGCGRTGVICAIDYTWKLLKDGIIPENFSIYDLIQEMRTQRTSIVQTKEQYELVYNAISGLFEKHIEFLNTNSTFCADEIDEPSEALERHQQPPTHIPLSSNSSSHSSPKEENSLLIMAQEITDLQPSDQREELGFCPLGRKPSYGLITDLNSDPSKCGNVSGPQDPSSCITRCPPERKPGRQLDLDDDGISWGEVSQSSARLPQERKEFTSKACLSRAKSNPFSATSQDIEHSTGLFKVKQSNFFASLEDLLTSSSSGSSSSKSNSSPAVEKAWNSCHWGSAQEENTNIPEDPEKQYFVHFSSPVHFLSSYFTEDPYFSPPNSAQLQPPEDSAMSCLNAPCQYLDKLIPARCRSENDYSELPTFPRYMEPGLAQPVEEEHCHSIAEVKENNSDEEIPPPLPVRTPESYILPDDPETVPAPPVSQKIGTSSEWSGSTQPKTFIESTNVKTRSKSLKLRAFRMERKCDSLTLPNSITLPQSASRPPSSPETANSRSSADSNKPFARSKSLKILRNMKKTMTSVPAMSRSPETEPNTEHTRSFLNFGFKCRFAKSKGPRNPPADWV